MWIERQMFAIIEECYNKVNLRNNTCQILSILVDTLMKCVHNTFHYADMTGDTGFLSSGILVWDCVSLLNMYETLYFICLEN